MPTPIAAEKRPMRPNPVPVTVATEKSSPLRRLELGSPVADETASLRTQVVELHGALAETQGSLDAERHMTQRLTAQLHATAQRQARRPPSVDEESEVKLAHAARLAAEQEAVA